MEHEIIVTVRRYQPSTYPGQVEPEEIEVYHMKRVVSDNDLGKLYDIFDEAKMEAGTAVDADVTENCDHSAMEEDFGMCPTCGRSLAELQADDQERRVDNAIDEAKLNREPF